MKIHVPGVLLFLLLAGCNPMNAVSGKTDADGDPVYRKNPHPTQAYRITVTIEDAPGPFGYVSGAAFYDMTNRDDSATIDPIFCMSTKPKEDSIPIHFQKTNGTTYVATIHADGVMDTNYYDKGIHRFELSGVWITLSATGKHEETRFQPALLKGEIYGLTPKITYFWKGRYPMEDMDNFPDSGRIKIE
ncbi:hypothetical protein ACFOPN_13345 [Xanthomonas hyacinthi]|uniref:hypothetical protein n=1 Tax=Xanthomonas hyacinthi TaxID=56455 RepID=UPI0031378982